MENDAMTEQELEKALRTAAEADVAVIFAGLPEIFVKPIRYFRICHRKSFLF